MVHRMNEKKNLEHIFFGKQILVHYMVDFKNVYNLMKTHFLYFYLPVIEK